MVYIDSNKLFVGTVCYCVLVIVEVFDRDNKKMAGYKLNNVEYYILDLSALDTGPYDIRVTVMGQTLVHNVPVINPAHNGEQKR